MSEAEPGEINATTRFCAVFGHPIAHSASPAMHNAALAALGLNWRYLAFDVHPEHLAAAIAGAKAMKFAGLNLTVPHKLPALELVDAVSESAQRWGAVNTIRFEAERDGDWQPVGPFSGQVPEKIRSVGFNTDADALIRSLREDLGLGQFRDLSVLLLGAGGAGRVTALKLASEGVRALFLVNRTVSKADQVAAEIRRLFPDRLVTVGYPEETVDLVINATSLGLQAADALPFEATKFPLARARAAYDMIYQPAQTPFLKAATQAGCRSVNGLGMLLYQGAAALELWTDRSAPVPVMRRALERQVYGH